MAKVEPVFDYFFKVLVVGESGVGKTCLLQRFADDDFKLTYTATIGIDYKVRTLTVGNDVVKLQVWDTAGQERFRTLTSAYFRGANGIILVYDITQELTFEQLPGWLTNIKEEAPHNIEMIVLGNKSDLEDDRKVPSERGQTFAEEHGLHFMEVSAFSDVNVSEAFLTLAQNIRDSKMTQTPSDYSGSDKYQLTDPPQAPEQCLC